MGISTVIWPSSTAPELRVALDKFASDIARYMGVIEEVPTLPATASYVGKSVTYEDQVYTWVGGSWMQLIDLQWIGVKVMDAQMEGVAASKVTGTFSAEQQAGLDLASMGGQITETQIANDAITSPKVQAGAIYGTHVYANSITGGNIAGSTITADNIASRTITAEKIMSGVITAYEISAAYEYVGSLLANRIYAGTIASNVVYAGMLAANQINAGTLNSGVLNTGTMNANQITAGTLGANVIYTGTLSANKILAGTLNSGVINTGTMSASLITAGTMNAARIYGGTLGACLINAGTISANIITTGTMSANLITGGTMLAARIYGGTMGACLINAGTINANVISVGTLTADVIASRSIYGIKLGTGNTYGIVTDNLVDQAVTQVDTGFWGAGTTATYLAPATVGSAYLNTNGGAVYLFFEGQMTASSVLDHIELSVNGTYLTHRNFRFTNTDSVPATISYAYAPAAGAYTYLITSAVLVPGTYSNTLYDRSLMAMEIKK